MVWDNDRWVPFIGVLLLFVHTLNGGLMYTHLCSPTAQPPPHALARQPAPLRTAGHHSCSALPPRVASSGPNRSACFHGTPTYPVRPLFFGSQRFNPLQPSWNTSPPNQTHPRILLRVRARDLRILVLSCHWDMGSSSDKLLNHTQWIHKSHCLVVIWRWCLILLYRPLICHQLACNLLLSLTP